MNTSNSFKNSLQTSIDQVLESFITLISTKYNIDKLELLSDWGSHTNNTISSEQSSAKVEKNENAYSKLSKIELVTICKEKGIKVSGSKQDLIERILNTESKALKSIENTSVQSNVQSTIPLENEQKKTQPLLKKLISATPTFLIKRNSYGNYEHPESSIVFDNITKKAIGTQGKDGQVIPLSKEDIESCHKYNFSYVVPEKITDNSEQDDTLVHEAEEEYEEVEEVEELAEEVEEEVEIVEEDEEEYEEVEEEYEEYEEE